MSLALLLFATVAISLAVPVTPTAIKVKSRRS